LADQRDVQLAEAILLPEDAARGRTGWWRGAVFYEIYVRSFLDSRGDGVGDLAGITGKLDYLASLGIDAIWLTPFYPSPQEDFGYDITDLQGVDPLFGTQDDVIALLDRAHARGLRVIADFVPGHTSVAHPWFAESRQDRDNPRADWYVWADPAPDGGPPNNWLSSFGGSAWEWEPRRAQYYYHPFLVCQPALDLHNEDALAAVIRAMCFWRDLGFDGLRLDAVQCLTCDRALRANPPSAPGDAAVAVGGGPGNPFRQQAHFFDRDLPDSLGILERMRAEVTDGHPDFALIGELADMDSSRLAAKYTAGTGRLHAVYDFDLIQKGRSVRRWIELLRDRNRFIASGCLLNVLTNHDSERAVSRLLGTGDGARAEAAKALLFLLVTLEGGAIVYQGEELGLPQPQLTAGDLRDPWAINLWPDFAGRDGVRTPMPWQAEPPGAGFTAAAAPWMPIPDAHRPLAVDRQQDAPDSVLETFRRLMAWRAAHPQLRSGPRALPRPRSGAARRVRPRRGGAPSDALRQSRCARPVPRDRRHARRRAR
jgi:alpha-glucosidase